jgi:hypothetical protein
LIGTDSPGFRELETEALEFRGHASWPEATVFDGKVRVHFHFEFFDKAVS